MPVCYDDFHTPAQPVEQGERRYPHPPKCDSCGNEILLSWIARDEEWAVAGNGDGVLCPACFDAAWQGDPLFWQPLPESVLVAEFQRGWDSALTTANQQIEELRAENETLKERDGILDAIEHDYGKRVAAEAELEELRADGNQLREAIRPILAAYRSESAQITEQQITKAWTAFDLIHDEAVELVKTRCCRLTKSGKHQRDCPRIRAVDAEERLEAAEALAEKLTRERDEAHALFDKRQDEIEGLRSRVNNEARLRGLAEAKIEERTRERDRLAFAVRECDTNAQQVGDPVESYRIAKAPWHRLLTLTGPGPYPRTEGELWKARASDAEAKIEELTREREEGEPPNVVRDILAPLIELVETTTAQRDTLREAVSAAFSATYNPDISHLTSTKTVRNILQSVLSTPPDKGTD